METVREIPALCFNFVSFITVVLFTFKPCSCNVHVPVACVEFMLLLLSNQNYLMYLELQGSTTVKKSLPSDLFVRNFSPIHVSTLCSPQSHLTLFSLLYYRYSKWPLFPKDFLKKFCTFLPLLLPCMLYVTVNLFFFILQKISCETDRLQFS